MLLRARFRRSRSTLLFTCFLVLTAIVYALLNVLTVAPSGQQQQQRRLSTDAQLTFVVSNGSGHRPVSVASLRLVRRSSVQEATESPANSVASSNGENATDDDGLADTGMEKEGVVMRQQDVEQRVRREVSRLRLRPPKSVQYSHGQWQTVDCGRQVYIYSAFYDSRPGIDWPQVRVIAVAESDVHLYGLCCLLWYRSRRSPDVAEISVLPIGPKISPGGLTVFEQFIFSCRLDGNKTDAPVSVSLVAPHNFRLSNLLPVQVPERPEHVLEFGHCMSILYWKQDPFRLVEWLEAHRLWGVGEVNVYTTLVDNATDSILKRYADTGFVRYRQSPGPLGDDSEYSILLSMSPVINDCMYRNMYRYRYVVCTDLDELIVPANPHRNYSGMLRAAAAAATRANAIIHSYLFRNIYFFLDFGPTETEPWYLLTQRWSSAICSAPSPGWGPRAQGPSKNRQGPGKNNWTDHVPSGLPYKNFGIFGHFCY